MIYKRICTAIAVAGTLDIASACLLTLAAGRSVTAMLAGIAAGPFGDRMLDAGPLAALCGLAVHYALIAVMVAAFAALASRSPTTRRHPVIAGIAYGLLIYGVMYWVVIPARWPDANAVTSFRTVAIPIAIHITLVGLPIALLVVGGKRDGKPVAATPGRQAADKAN